jgi:hypothetical protein
MGPAKDRPNDKPEWFRRAVLHRATMEPTAEWPDDQLPGEVHASLGVAAMEPAKDQPDDAGTSSRWPSATCRRNGAGQGSAG